MGLIVLAFLALVTAAALGVVGMVRLATGRPLIPPQPVRRRRRRLTTHDLQLAGIGLLAGTAVAALTRWPVAAVMAAAVVVLWPRITGGGAAERRSLEKIEAIAEWTEALRDAASTDSALESAIPATLEGTPRLLRQPVRTLIYQLGARVPLPEALTLFADEVDDAGADRVVAALSINARERGSSLRRVLTALATNSRRELEMRRKVLHERNAVRRQAQQVAVLILILAAGIAVFIPEWVAPYGTEAGQMLLAALALVYLGLMVRMRKLAAPDQRPRFLQSADIVTRVAAQQGTVRP